jgi:hypothetical protein
MKSGRSPKLKRRSTRHVSEITAIGSEFGNSAKIIVPRSWLGKSAKERGERSHSFIRNISQNILRSEGKMSSEALLSNIVPFAGSGLLGYIMGFALKKVMKCSLSVFNYYKSMGM